MYDSDLKQVTAYVSQEDYNLLHLIINITGVKQSPSLMGAFLMKGIKHDLMMFGNLGSGMEKYQECFDELPEHMKQRLQLQIIAFQNRIKEDEQATLNHLVSKGLDTRQIDVIHDIAEDLNLDIEEANRFADSPFSSVVAYANTSTKKGKCIQWLSTVFDERAEVPIQEVLLLADKHGFSEIITKRAKRALGLGHGKRTGDGVWCWYSPTLDIGKNSTQPCTSSVTLRGNT